MLTSSSLESQKCPFCRVKETVLTTKEIAHPSLKNLNEFSFQSCVICVNIHFIFRAHRALSPPLSEPISSQT